MISQKSTVDPIDAALERPPHSEIVSIVLPTCNRSRLVCRAIDSVLAQSYRAIELIVVDDGSTDDTQNRLERYGDCITVIEQANKGVSAARNAGLQAASGQYVALLDSDDVWLPRKLERQVAFFRSRPGAVICQTEEIWIRNGVRVNPGKRHKKHSGMIFEKTLPLCLISPSAVMLRKSLFDEVGLFDESLPACEDYDLWLRISWKYPVHLIDTPLIHKHGGHADQLSRMPQLDKYRIRALEKILEADCLSQQQRSAALETLKQKCRIYAAGCGKRGRIDDARHYAGLPDRLRHHRDG
jgi:glycosyltransferase involved in cell wall biosynthesis